MEITINLPPASEKLAVLGSGEANLKLIRDALGVRITARDDTIHFSGKQGAVNTARSVLTHLIDQSRRSHPTIPSREMVLDLIAQQSPSTHRSAHLPPRQNHLQSSHINWNGRLDVYVRGRAVKPRSLNQQHYLEAIMEHDLTIAIGPAGTGKTYLAVAAAAHMLKTGQIRKIILARPAVEAGEKLGYLPGTVEAKVNPFLRPLFDALHDMMDYAQISRFMESDVIEVVPLAYMRGRTLNDAAIICDEAQNTTKGQMQMFLTRMGAASKMIVTGDITQIDLPDPRQSGLIDAARRLRRVPGVASIVLESADVIRHPLVARIIQAYGQRTDDTIQTNLLAEKPD